MADWYITDAQVLNDGGTHSYNNIYIYGDNASLTVSNGTILQCDAIYVGSDGSTHTYKGMLTFRDTSQLIFNDVSGCGLFAYINATVDFQGTDSNNKITIKSINTPPTNYPDVRLPDTTATNGTGEITVKNAKFDYVKWVVLFYSNASYNSGVEFNNVDISNTKTHALYLYRLNDTSYHNDASSAVLNYSNAKYKFKNITITNAGSNGFNTYISIAYCGVYLESFTINNPTGHGIAINYYPQYYKFAGIFNITQNNTSSCLLFSQMNRPFLPAKADVYFNLAQNGSGNLITLGNSFNTRPVIKTSANTVSFNTSYNGIGPLVFEKLTVTANQDCQIVTVSQENEDEEYQYCAKVTANTTERVYAAKYRYDGLTQVWLTGDGTTYKKTKVKIIPPDGYFVSALKLDGADISAADEIEVDMSSAHSLEITFAEKSTPTISSASLSSSSIKENESLTVTATTAVSPDYAICAIYDGSELVAAEEMTISGTSLTATFQPYSISAGSYYVYITAVKGTEFDDDKSLSLTVSAADDPAEKKFYDDLISYLRQCSTLDDIKDYNISLMRDLDLAMIKDFPSIAILPDADRTEWGNIKTYKHNIECGILILNKSYREQKDSEVLEWVIKKAGALRDALSSWDPSTVRLVTVLETNTGMRLVRNFKIYYALMKIKAEVFE